MDPLKKLAREEANKTLSFLIPWMLVFVVIAFIAMQAVAIRAKEIQRSPDSSKECWRCFWAD